mgnify:CR=1 FL=1|jgi:hypothetical protein
MKNTGTLKPLGLQPKLYIKESTLLEIKEIVRLAPDEVQWFYRPKTIKTDKVWGYIIEDLFVPEQYCSGAEVETTGFQQVGFFNELREEHGTEGASEIIQTISCWCHSHANLGTPKPSGQDNKTFQDMMEAFEPSPQKPPVIMLIFTKSGSYYSRVYDPDLGMTFENMDIKAYGADLGYIKEILDKKIKKRQQPSSLSLPKNVNDSIPPKLQELIRGVAEANHEEAAVIAKKMIWHIPVPVIKLMPYLLDYASEQEILAGLTLGSSPRKASEAFIDVVSSSVYSVEEFKEAYFTARKLLHAEDDEKLQIVRAWCNGG